MRRLFAASAVCALAIGLLAVPAALGVKVTKNVDGTVSVNVTPNPVPNTATTVTASGNVASNSSCRKDRTVHFEWVDATTSAVAAAAESAETRSNGNYTATVTKPAAGTYTLKATVDEAIRKVGGKKKGKKTKKGRRFRCLELTGSSSPVIVSP